MQRRSILGGVINESRRAPKPAGQIHDRRPCIAFLVPHTLSCSGMYSCLSLGVFCPKGRGWLGESVLGGVERILIVLRDGGGGT
jgi:hypothetical protein